MFHLPVSRNGCAMHLCSLRLLSLVDDGGNAVTYNLVSANAFNHIFVDANAKMPRASAIMKLCSVSSSFSTLSLYHRSSSACSRHIQRTFPCSFSISASVWNSRQIARTHTLWLHFEFVSLGIAQTEKKTELFICSCWLEYLVGVTLSMVLKRPKIISDGKRFISGRMRSTNK